MDLAFENVLLSLDSGTPVRVEGWTFNPQGSGVRGECFRFRVQHPDLHYPLPRLQLSDSGFQVSGFGF